LPWLLAKFAHAMQRVVGQRETLMWRRSDVENPRALS
jgi:hypothetical protein